MKLIYDTAEQCLVGHTLEDVPQAAPAPTQILLAVPKGFDVANAEAYQEYSLAAGKLVRDGATQLLRVKRDQVNLIRTRFNAKVESLRANAAPYELETWAVQRSEFVAWSQDVNAAVPYTAALASARGMPLQALMERIGQKIAALATLHGTQQALEKRVEDATTVQEARAVVSELPL